MNINLITARCCVFFPLSLLVFAQSWIRSHSDKSTQTFREINGSSIYNSYYGDELMMSDPAGRISTDSVVVSYKEKLNEIKKNVVEVS